MSISRTNIRAYQSYQRSWALLRDLAPTFLDGEKKAPATGKQKTIRRLKLPPCKIGMFGSMVSVSAVASSRFLLESPEIELSEPETVFLSFCKGNHPTFRGLFYGW